MSDVIPPAHSDAQGAPSASPHESAALTTTRQRRRLVNISTFVLLSVAVGVVAVTAFPELLRAAGLVEARPSVAFHPGGRFSPLSHRGDAPPSPLFGPEGEKDDGRRVTELERLYPEGMWPGRRSPEERQRDQEMFPEPRDRPRAGPESDGPRVHEPGGPGEARARFGVVRQRIQLIDNPGEEGATLGYVERGKMVMVIKELGDYALVAYSGAEGVLIGWTKKSEIAVR